jgi:hypothetical protein
MKFVTKEDIECPIAHVFAQVADFAGFERQALRRGANVRRTDQKPQQGLGSGWHVVFSFRGKERQMQAVVTAWDPPNGYGVQSSSSGIDGTVVVELVPLSRNRTRLSLSIELKPKTIAARIMVQSLRLGRGTLQRRLDLRMSDYASEIVERYRPV